MRRFVIALPLATYRTFPYVIPTNNAFPIRGDMGTATIDGHDSNSLKINEETHN